jgi:excisionase family DNA binding protein
MSQKELAERMLAEVQTNNALLSELLGRMAHGAMKKQPKKGANELDYNEAAQLLGVCRRQVNRYVEAGKLHVVHKGWRTRYFDRKDVLKFKEQMDREGYHTGRPRGS